jgi:hypothetical protein
MSVGTVGVSDDVSIVKPEEIEEREDGGEAGRAVDELQHKAATKLQALERQRQASRRYKVHKLTLNNSESNAKSTADNSELDRGSSSGCVIY